MAVNVYSSATVKATSTTAASYGIFALNNGTGNISVITSPGVTISSGSTGINAVNQATAIEQSAQQLDCRHRSGNDQRGKSFDRKRQCIGRHLCRLSGRHHRHSDHSCDRRLWRRHRQHSATINTAAGDGIYVYTYGIGDLFVNDLGGNITALGGASPPNGSGVGIVANNYGSGDVRISTAATTVINSDGTGIAAINKAVSGPSFTVPSTSEISVLALGTIHSGTITTGSGLPPAGILASYNPNNTNTVDASVHGNVLVDDYASIFAAAGTDGIRGSNYGTGTVTITVEAGAIVSAGRYGIAAQAFNGGDVSVTNYGTVSGRPRPSMRRRRGVERPLSTITDT